VALQIRSGFDPTTPKISHLLPDLNQGASEREGAFDWEQVTTWGHFIGVNGIRSAWRNVRASEGVTIAVEQHFY